MQELKKKHRKKPKKELDRGAQKEQKNLTDITEEQLKVNIGIVRLGNMIKVIQIVMKVLLCMLAVLFSFLAILLHEARLPEMRITLLTYTTALSSQSESPLSCFPNEQSRYSLSTVLPLYPSDSSALFAPLCLTLFSASFYAFSLTPAILCPLLNSNFYTDHFYAAKGNAA